MIKLTKDFEQISYSSQLDDRYLLLEHLGEGSYGTVIKVKHSKTGKVYAMKQIEDVFRNSYESKKVLREIKIMRYLS